MNEAPQEQRFEHNRFCAAMDVDNLARSSL